MREKIILSSAYDTGKPFTTSKRLIFAHMLSSNKRKNYKAFKAMNHRKLAVFSGVLFLSKSSRINPVNASFL
jgi:hypothetical protein